MKRAEGNAGRALRQLFMASIALVFASGALYASTGAANPNYTYFWLAIEIPLAVVAIAYMASYVFNAPSLRAVLQDELLQIMATGAVALTLVGTQAVVDQYLVSALQGAGGGGALNAADTTLSSLLSQTENALSDMENVSMALGAEASKGVFCNFLGVGFSVSNCSPFNAYRGSLTSASFTATLALSDAYAQGFLLSLARQYAFTLLIPLGLMLRCFKVGRAAGGALIAIGFGFYTVFPVSLIANDTLLYGGAPPAPPIPLPKVGTCNVVETNVDVSRAEFTAYGAAITDFNTSVDMASFVLVRVLFMSILNIIITLSFIRAFAHIIGSDIDVSALARIS